MISILAVAVTEIATGQTIYEQIANGGAIPAVGLSLLTTLASVAPALTGAVKPEAVYPQENDPTPNKTLEYFW